MNDKIAIVALGANLKDRAGTLSAALRRLDAPRLPPHHDVCCQLKLDKHRGPLPVEYGIEKHRGQSPHEPPVLRRVVAVSPFYETVPVDVPTEQPNFINAVAALAVGDDETPESLLQTLLQTEREFGRVRSYKNAPRTCDLDLIFFEDETRSSDALVLPHPRWKERAFVLVPFNDLLRSKASWCSREPWCSIAVEIADALRTIDISGVRRATR